MRGRHLIVFRHVVAALLGFAFGGAPLSSRSRSLSSEWC
jgi:hypothetical protein